MRGVWSLFLLISSFLQLSAAHATSEVCTLALTSDSRPTAVVVDGFSSGKLLAPELRRRGYRVVHVMSQGRPLAFQAGSYAPETFDEELIFNGSFPALMARLQNLAPRAVLVGAESGVLLADRIADALPAQFGVPSNGVSLARRDKYFQSEAVRAAGIPAVRQIATADVGEALAFVRAHHLLPGRIVIKPRNSGGGDGVTFVQSEAELIEKFGVLLGRKNPYENIDDTLLVQEFLEGTEYVVNLAASQGRVVITDIWEYQKRDLGMTAIYDVDRLLPFDGPLQAQLVAYVERVVAALGIRTGWGHAEVKMTPRGPILVEIGARMMGSGQPRLVQAALGSSQVDIGVDAFLDPMAFAARPRGYEYKNASALVTFSSFKDRGHLNVTPTLESLIKNVRGYHAHSFYFKNGAEVPRTVDMNTGLGQVELIHPDPQVLEKSIEALRTLDQSGILIDN